MRIWYEVLCAGDSLTYGARDAFGRSYPAELARILQTKTGWFWFCHNCGINGETSSDLLRRCWNVFNGFPNAKIVILLIGTNDTKIPTPEDIFYDNLRQIIGAAQVQGKQVILATLPPLEFSPFYTANRDYIGKYSQIISAIAKQYRLPLCAMSGLDSSYLIDGVHLSHEGNIKMAEAWSEVILSL